MTALKKRSLYYVVSVLTTFLLLGSAFAYNSTESMLPQGLIIEDVFQPGYGSPVGRVLVVQGNVVIMHKDMLRGYRAKKDLPLFKRDIIVTQKKGRIHFEMNDGSTLTLGSSTKLVIDRSMYDTKKKSRSSFFRLALGKARFWAKKLMDFKHSRFKVRTPTAVVGVRGSDFIVKATLKLTEVTALDKTVLKVVSLAFPEIKPMVVTEFEQTVVEEGAIPADVKIIAPEEIEEMKKDFIVTPDVTEPEEKLKKLKQKEPVKPLETILIPEEDLVKPEDPGALEYLIGPVVPDIIEKEEVSSQEEEIIEQASEIEESIAEEGIFDNLPEFPQTP
jgi:hypothetical protein